MDAKALLFRVGATMGPTRREKTGGSVLTRMRREPPEKLVTRTGEPAAHTEFHGRERRLTSASDAAGIISGLHFLGSAASASTLRVVPGAASVSCLCLASGSTSVP